MIACGLHIEGAGMRGSDAKSVSLFSYVDLEERVPTQHPLRVIKSIVDKVLLSLDGEFAKLYEGTGRQSIGQSGGCGPRCCRRSTRCAPSAS
jgi:hypothetical protein